jgi:hypothetical protein
LLPRALDCFRDEPLFVETGDDDRDEALLHVLVLGVRRSGQP